MSGRLPKDARLLPTEAEEQATLFSWAAMKRGKYPELDLLFHIPNGGSRGKAEAARFKAEGVKPGVPDLFLPVARGNISRSFYRAETAERRPGERGTTRLDHKPAASGLLRRDRSRMGRSRADHRAVSDRREGGAVKKILRHIRKWKEWRKRSLNSGLYKTLVLLGFLRSPTFELYIPSEEWKGLLLKMEQEIGK